MDDFTDKISEILNDPQSIEKMRGIAEQLLGGEQKATKPAEPSLDLAQIEDTVDIAKIISLFNTVNNKNDDRTKLLLALKPHLSPERRQRVDKAVKILRLIEIMPILQESGLLNLG